MASLPTHDLSRVRALWWERQHLEQRDLASPRDVFRLGWMYSGKICAPHLSCFARTKKVTREAIDGPTREGLLRDLSTVRMCGMVVPREEAALALRMSGGEMKKRLAQMARKLDWNAAELPAAKKAVLAALKKGAKNPQALRKAIPDEVVVAFGDAGKKIGETSSLPITLQALQVDGSVRRVTEDGRLDGMRYVYELASDNVVAEAALPKQDAAAHALLARRFFDWAGPATRAEFAWWAGINQTQAKAAIDGADLTAISVPGFADEAWLLPEDVTRLKSAGKPTSVRFLPLRDNYLYFRRDATVFLDEGERDVRLFSMGMTPKATPIEKVNSVFNQTIFEGGKLAGAWEWDPDTTTVHTKYFGMGTGREPTGKRKAAFEAEADALRTFLVEKLDNPVTFPMDSPKSRAKRIALLAEL